MAGPAAQAGPHRPVLQTIGLGGIRFKAHNIGGLGHDYQSGILWSAYPIKLWALVPCRHRMQKKHAETRPQETPHHPERLTRSTRNEGPSVLLVKWQLKRDASLSGTSVSRRRQAWLQSRSRISERR